MKRIKMILVILISFFVSINPVLAETSKFEATINMEPEITENQINLVLGFRGEEVMAVKETITYDATRLTLLDIVPIDNFTVTKGNETIDGKWHTVKLVADSIYSFNDTNYAIAVFEVKDNFKVKKESDVFLYGVEGSGTAKIKYRYRGDYVLLTRESNTNMYMDITPIKDGAKFSYYIKKYLVIGIVVLVVLLALIIIIFINLPSHRKKENRDKAVSDSIKEENYQKNSNEIKFDLDHVSDEENKNIIKLSDAILVSDTKPFEDNLGKNEVLNETKNDNSLEVSINPFNITVEEQAAMNVQEINKEDMLEEKQEVVEEIPQTNDLKAPVFTQEIGNSNENTNNSNIGMMLLLFGISILSLISFNVYAIDLNSGMFEGIGTPAIENNNQTEEEKEEIENNYRVDEIRECIVGNIPFNEELDYNKDGKVDILDLIETKNLVNVNFEELLKTDPGFKEIHGQSPNILGEKILTSKVIIKKKTTTKKKTNEGSEGNNTKKTTSSKSTTTKKTTNDMPIDETIKYQVNVMANNGIVNNSSSQTVASGKTANFVVVPNTGFEFSSVSCTNGIKATYSKTNSTLKVASIKNNTTCTVEFAAKSNLKVTINAVNGTSKPKSSNVTYGGSTQFTVTPKSGYAYTNDNVSCTNGATGIYSGNSLGVSNVTTNTTCTITFSKQDYKINVYVNNNLIDSQSISYGETYHGQINVPSKNGELKCNGSKVTPSKKKSSDDNYVWSFSKKITEETNCYITLN